MLLSFEFDGGLPGYDLIEEILLFNAAFVKIDAGGLDTFVTQNIGEKCNIIASFHKIFCEQMAEGMRVNNGWIKMIAQSENFQLITLVLIGRPKRFRNRLPLDLFSFCSHIRQVSCTLWGK